MEGELEPEEEGKFLKPNLSRPINICPDSINLSRSFYTTSTVNSTTSSSSSSPPELVRLVHAAFKRNRPLGMIQPSKFKPKRNVPKREISSIKPNPAVDDKRGKKDISQDDRFRSPFSQSKSIYSVTGEKQNHEDGTMTAPSEWGSTVNNTREENIEPYNSQRDQPGLPTMCSINNAAVSSCPESRNILTGVQKKVQFATNSSATSCGANYTMATRTDDLLSHMDSLALTEMEYDQGNQADTPSAMNDHWQHNNFQGMEIHSNLRSGEGISSLLAGQTDKDFGNFLRNDLIGAMTQSSVAGSSCVTSTLINPNSAPVVSSTTYPSQPQAIGAQIGSEPTGADKLQTDAVQQSGSLSKHADGVVSHYSTVTSQAIRSHDVMAKEPQSSLPNEFDIPKNSSPEDNNVCKGNVMNVTSQSSNVPLSDEKLENLKPERVQRGASGKAASTSRKRDYNPDLFFKVNEKMYQRLGKIGSGGSSEVHKVISSDCAIFALKKIRLKGRDYATAYGFCQEIEYLNKLKGKSNIIQLIDYEVTDKRLLQEVMNGSMSDKDGRIKDDQYIYMVLEYGEIDLAHMLAHKWKELDSSDTTIDENWLRFYWQQILQAVNTIHEERIVHSDLKPANFLLVRGSLKLIDFGIAKAIMNDTTNIQRDSQVGTLSYMSPEAFLCNETDANGNVIKCGRPSDIWSLGCILYQMVYGRTPFSEYKTFWAKFKVITDPNHEITYEPVSNPWLLDLMKKCLAWERNDRWRIPQLLQHPFLVPPVPHQLPAPPEQSLKAFQHISELCANDQKSSMLCSQLQETLRNPEAAVETDSSVSKHLARKFLCKISNLCFQLQEQLAKL